MALSEVQASAPADPAAAAALRHARLTEPDIHAGLALSDAAGWNQTSDDWALFIRHGRTIGLRDAAGRWVATAAALPYGRDRGWISMVLVDAAWRHRGLASRLLDECVAHLRAEGIVPVLDATPAGAAVYRRLGFVPGFEIDRWERPALAAGTATPATSPAVMPAGLADLDTLLALDRAATGLDRRFLLSSFLSRPGTQAWRADDGRGFVIARAGRRAVQIGPLVAGDGWRWGHQPNSGPARTNMPVPRRGASVAPSDMRTNGRCLAKPRRSSRSASGRWARGRSRKIGRPASPAAAARAVSPQDPATITGGGASRGQSRAVSIAPRSTVS